MESILDYELKDYEIEKVLLIQKPPIERRCILCGEFFKGNDLVIKIIAVHKNYQKYKIKAFDLNYRKIPKKKLFTKTFIVHLKCALKNCGYDLCLDIKKKIVNPFHGKERRRFKYRLQIWFYKYVKSRFQKI
ncbi:hypothetical protein DRP04_10365 [Archaeoglobales archaeon]|nr:MAG: hypothetical protein DRP04_10365 [Archaeoglobales archaeon]